MDNLLPCPFCGAAGLNHESRNSIECRRCPGGLIVGDMDFDISPEEADRIVVAAWNRRSSGPVGDREEVARIIDPESWALIDALTPNFLAANPGIGRDLIAEWQSTYTDSLETADAILALSRQQAVPDGWVVVPRPATAEMYAAGNRATREIARERGGHLPNWLGAHELRRVFDAMLSAAPPVPVDQEGGEK